VISLLLDDAVSLIKGEPARPVDIAAKLARSFALIGVTGTVRMALPLASGDTELEELFEQAETEQRFEDAAALYERCLSLDPKDVDAAFNLANCLVAADRPDQARAAFLTALKLDPDFVEAWFNLASLAKGRCRTTVTSKGNYARLRLR
jgi:tetratricopeptide (TPR) repeat protein